VKQFLAVFESRKVRNLAKDMCFPHQATWRPFALAEATFIVQNVQYFVFFSPRALHNMLLSFPAIILHPFLVFHFHHTSFDSGRILANADPSFFVLGSLLN